MPFAGHGTRTAASTALAYSGLRTTLTDDHGGTRVVEKNPAGLVVRTTDALGGQLVLQHDAFANLVATKDALNNRVRMLVDIRGNKRQLRDPDAGMVNYAYNALGELVEQINAT